MRMLSSISAMMMISRLHVENGDDLWEQLNEALSAKKAELSQESSWGKPKPVSSTWSYRALKGSAMGPTMALLRSKNKLRNR